MSTDANKPGSVIEVSFGTTGVGNLECYLELPGLTWTLPGRHGCLALPRFVLGGGPKIIAFLKLKPLEKINFTWRMEMSPRRSRYLITWSTVCTIIYCHTLQSELFSVGCEIRTRGLEASQTANTTRVPVTTYKRPNQMCAQTAALNSASNTGITPLPHLFDAY